ncbi:MAG: L-histidine N(alpha)-methyltransferase [Pegethrix bostrychoides GSE-TBD4-15B]|uniref:L-histidine N(Alpha)-methyltransferase n=1 Tax=Pegethrix bostrychoides GSE-TBD4-15B TaxID=2839662 RepID=A0A951U6Z2_9CYAN|nr:L-histidine N(alpha)-methyltransferase [Pegethrix bostrychoides GSE-TBD4-15B]
MTTSSCQSTVQLYDLHPPLDDFRSEVLRGLMQPAKSISPKFLYDKQGAELFDEICELEEYYLTRTELSILQAYAPEIAAYLQEAVLVEFGSGSSQKVRILLDAMPDLLAYVALDISRQHLQESCENLAIAYPHLKTVAICADYMQPLELPNIPALQQRRRVGFFPGSTIGNLEPAEAVQFLKQAAILLGAGGGLLIGVDLQKSPDILEPAYNDAQGISAEFALNVLTRINRELGADFNRDQFEYTAVYNQTAGRIEMYITSLTAQTIHLDGVKIAFEQGERLRTEYSYKYSVPQFQALAALAGLEAAQVWIDPQQLFSLHYLQLPKR